MATFFLVVIYITFIGLGLPDSMLGVAWPVLYRSLNTSIGNAGILTMVVSAGTVISSLSSERLIRRLGTGKVTFVSVMATAAALLGFSLAPSFGWLVLLAIPLGLGAGSVDAGLNNYVALHYKPHHMSWLHCFWGVGAFTGPFIISAYLRENGNWRGSILTVAGIQFVIVLLLLFTLPLWKRNDEQPDPQAEEETQTNPAPLGSPFRLRGVAPALLAFACYSSVEIAMNSWCASFLVETKKLDPALAAQWVAVFFIGITVGRLATGFLTLRIRNSALIRMGQGVILAGVILLVLPQSIYFALGGIVLIGLGCAPVFPCMLHETPRRFGKEWSQKIMGLQMATGYLAATFVPLIIGLIGSRFGFEFMPFFILGGGVLMLIASERVNRAVKNRENGGGEIELG